MGELLRMMGRMRVPTLTELMRPNEFVELTQRQKDNIETCKFVPPSLGDTHFGRVQVTYKTPVLRETK